MSAFRSTTRHIRALCRISVRYRALPKRTFHSCQRVLTGDKPTEDDTRPWYLRPEVSPSVQSPLKHVEEPDLPQNSPRALERVVKFVAEDLGIVDIEVFDLRNNGNADANEGATDIADFMVIGTGKSGKHLQKAAGELKYFLKHEFRGVPTTEGLLSARELSRAHQRLRRKGKGGPQYAKNDYGASPNTWVMTDCKADGIYVHMLTKERREDLNLELLWAKDKSKYQSVKPDSQSDSIFSGIRYYHTEADTPTETFDAFNLNRVNYSEQFQKLKEKHLANPVEMPLIEIQNHFDAMQANGLPLQVEDLRDYIDLICQSPEFHKGISYQTEAYEKRERYVSYMLLRYMPVISVPEDAKKLLPLLVVASSQFDNDHFVTLDKIPSLTEEQCASYATEQFKYSTVVHKLYQLSLKLTESKLDADGFQTEMDLLCLTIFINRQNWVYSRKVVENSLKREDISVLLAALRLLAIKGDVSESSHFLDAYYPLLKLHKSFKIEEEATYVRMLLNRCDPEGSHREEIRETL